jgi:hypothetical protein
MDGTATGWKKYSPVIHELLDGFWDLIRRIHFHQSLVNHGRQPVESEVAHQYAGFKAKSAGPPFQLKPPPSLPIKNGNPPGRALNTSSVARLFAKD